MSPTDDDLFRWQALFQRSREPVFLLNRKRRILFVNEAWEKLTGLPLAQARGLRCRRRKEAEPGSPEAIGHALAPPLEVLEGKSSRVRRPQTGSSGVRGWWDVEFFPLLADGGLLGILGKIVSVHAPAAQPAFLLPEKLLALRQELPVRYCFDQLNSEEPAMRRVLEQARLASQSRATVLIVGELGTGKTWLARAIHYEGITREQGFAAVDCTALPQAAVADVLFGSGGLLRPERLGTLFLREPVSLPRELQFRLSGWLAESDPGKPRVISACRRDPVEAVQTDRLLPELHGALATLPIALPPLRGRPDELQPMIERILVKAEAKPGTGLTPLAYEMIRDYTWPGNLRELYAAIQSSLAHATGERIDAADFPAYIRQAIELDRIPGRVAPRPLPLDSLLEQVERRLMVLSLRMAQGNRSEAARTLGISRARLLRRLEMLGISDK